MSRMSFSEATELLKDRGYEVKKADKSSEFKYLANKEGVDYGLTNGYEVVRFAKIIDSRSDWDEEAIILCDRYHREKDFDKKAGMFFQIDELLRRHRGILSATTIQRLQFIILMG